MTTPLSQPTEITTSQPLQYLPGTTTIAPTVYQVPQPQGRYFTEDEVERIRQQEKDKMYARLEKSEQQLNEFKTTMETLAADKKSRDEELARQQAEAEAEANKLRDEKLSVQELLDKQKADFERQQKSLREDMERRLAIAAKDQEILQLKSYIQRRINEEVNAATIIPDLVEYIDGDTEEQVEASIQKAKDKTTAIVNAAMGSNSGTSIPMGTSPTGTPFSPLDNLSGPRQPTTDQIAAMSNAQYAAWREQSGMARAGSGRGLFN
jgi:hypothetical protein